MLPIDAVRTIDFADAKIGDFLLEEQDGAFVVGDVAGTRFAVFLEGHYAGHAMELGPMQARKGLAIAGGVFEVDLTSWTSDTTTQGAILVGAGQAIMRAKAKIGAFEENVRVGLLKPTPPGASLEGFAAFSRWALVRYEQSGTRNVLFEQKRSEGGAGMATISR